MNTRNFKNLLKPFILAKLILTMLWISIGVYAFIHSNDNTVGAMISVQQIILAVMFIVLGVEEIKKPNTKKLSAYISFGLAIFLIIMNVIISFNKRF